MRAIQRSPEIITVGEDHEIALRNFLCEFNEKIWPIYQRYGFSKDAALADWNGDIVLTVLERIEKLLTEEDADDLFS